NVTAFLTNVWRSGALFGTTPQEAFYVKCDAETNPPELRDLGQVVTEIGVAIVRPAEFVIFRISQFSAPGKAARVESGHHDDAISKSWRVSPGRLRETCGGAGYRCAGIRRAGRRF